MNLKIIYIVFLSLMLLVGHEAEAQVGINTNNPNGVFQVNDNNNRVMITPTGDLGIGGNFPPNVKLDVRSTIDQAVIRIQDGDQATGKIMITDDNGVGLWDYLGLDVVVGTQNPVAADASVYLVSDIQHGKADGSVYPLKGTNIILPPGRWAVFVGIYVSPRGASATDNHKNVTWLRLSFAESEGGPALTSYMSNHIYSTKTTIIKGSTVIHNSTNQNKTYHLGIVFANGGLLSATTSIQLGYQLRGESRLFAIRMSDN